MFTRNRLGLVVGAAVVCLALLLWRGQRVDKPAIQQEISAKSVAVDKSEPPAVAEPSPGTVAVDKNARTVPRFRKDPETRPRRFQPKALKLFESQKEKPTVYYENEARDPVWAPAMERLLKERIIEMAAQQKTAGFKADRVDCKESTCKIEVSYGEADLEAARSQGALDPVLLGRRDNGQLATYTYLESAPPEFRKSMDPKAWVYPDGSVRKKIVLLFNEEEIDPMRYRDATAKR